MTHGHFYRTLLPKSVRDTYFHEIIQPKKNPQKRGLRIAKRDHWRPCHRLEHSSAGLIPLTDTCPALPRSTTRGATARCGSTPRDHDALEQIIGPLDEAQLAAFLNHSFDGGGGFVARFGTPASTVAWPDSLPHSDKLTSDCSPRSKGNPFANLGDGSFFLNAKRIPSGRQSTI